MEPTAGVNHYLSGDLPTALCGAHVHNLSHVSGVHTGLFLGIQPQRDNEPDDNTVRSMWLAIYNERHAVRLETVASEAFKHGWSMCSPALFHQIEKQRKINRYATFTEAQVISAYKEGQSSDQENPQDLIDSIPTVPKVHLDQDDFATLKKAFCGTDHSITVVCPAYVDYMSGTEIQVPDHQFLSNNRNSELGSQITKLRGSRAPTVPVAREATAVWLGKLSARIEMADESKCAGNRWIVAGKALFDALEQDEDVLARVYTSGTYGGTFEA